MRHSEQIERHYARIWGSTGAVCSWTSGSRAGLDTDFAVLAFSPSEHRRMWTYATRCMSSIADEQPLELHMFSPREVPAHTELLTAVAHYHRTGARLGLGHTVNFGRAWLPGSQCDHGLISLPYLDGPRLEELMVDGKLIRCLWLIPVTTAEVEFKKHHGLEALEARFETEQFSYIDPLRRSVA